MLYGFVIAQAFFTIVNLKDVVDGISGKDVPEYLIGKKLFSLSEQASSCLWYRRPSFS